MAIPPAKRTDLVVRSSTVPSFDDYRKYKPYLQRDFVHSCAYCTMTEAEAMAVRFAIDHYEPMRARPDLETDYTNLMYCCDECNLRKGDRSPPPEARAKQIRFFRPDTDHFEDHFKLNGIRLDPVSPTGDYTIHAIDLNRPMVRKLRELRQREKLAKEAVAAGVRALRNAPLDQLPSKMRGKAAAAITRAQNASVDLADAIDELLREHAQSPLVNLPPEPEPERKARAQRLKQIEALVPRSWRARDA